MKLCSWTLAVGLGIAAGALAGSLTPQDHDHPDEGEPPPKLDAEAVLRPSADELREELERLFGEVERNLESVDVLLTDAGAGDTAVLGEVEEAGIADLLTRSLELGKELQADIERIIEIAEQQGGT